MTGPRRWRTVRSRSGEDNLAEHVCRKDCYHTGGGPEGLRPGPQGTEQPVALFCSGRQDHRARCPQHRAGSDAKPRAAEHVHKTSEGCGLSGVCVGTPGCDVRGDHHHGDQPPSRLTERQAPKGTKLPKQAQRGFTVSASPQRSQKAARWLSHQGPGSGTMGEETSPRENEKVRDN